jgi:hypothetical protein
MGEEGVYLFNLGMGALWHGKDSTTAEAIERYFRAATLLTDLKPRDGLETRLIHQMIATHDAGMQCMRRANVPEQTFEGRDMALRHAEKLFSLFTRQIETLDKHRGKGQQKVTVEHVHVNAGGKAIVGTVNAGSEKQKKDAPQEPKQETLTYAPGQTLELGEAKELEAVPLKRADVKGRD